jgi:transposase
LVLLLASGSGYRKAVAISGISSRTAVTAIRRLRQGNLPALFRAGSARGRPSQMSSPAVKRYLIQWLAAFGRPVAPAEVVAELHRTFKFRLRPASLSRWLRKWQIKLPTHPRPVRTVPPVAISGAALHLIRCEEQRVAKALAEDPTSKSRRRLSIQQDQLALLDFIAEGGYSQQALAKHFGRSPNTINSWLRAFHSGRGGINGIKAMLALSQV